MRSRVLVVLGVLAVLASPLAALEVPYLAGRVNDTADLIPDDVEHRIDQKLAAFEQQTGIQIAVLTIESLEGEALEDYSLKVAETWKLGQKGKDNGALFLISEQDRKMRIEVGYGLEPELTDLESSKILDDVVRPYFRSGDFGAGVEHGVDAIMASVQGQEVTPAPGADSAAETPMGARVLTGLIFLVVIGTFSLMAIFSHGCQSWFLYAFLTPFYALFPSVVFPGLGIGAAIAWLVLFPLLKAWAVKTGKGLPTGSARPRTFWGPFLWGTGMGGGWRSGGWGSGGGWSSGGGGFSGGGGSFGGGGSSGSW
jgi:uncharacterized protein